MNIRNKIDKWFDLKEQKMLKKYKPNKFEILVFFKLHRWYDLEEMKIFEELNKDIRPYYRNKLIQLINQQKRNDYGRSTIYCILRGKDTNLFEKEWKEYVQKYNERVKKLSFFSKFIWNIKELSTTDMFLKNMNVIFNKHDYYNKSQIITLGNSFKVIHKNNPLGGGIPEIELILMNESSEDKVFEFELFKD